MVPKKHSMKHSMKHSKASHTQPTLRVSAGLLVYTRWVLSAIFFVSALYKLAYLDLASLSTSYYADDATIPLETLFGKPPAEFWPGLPCVRRFDDALQRYLFLAPTTIAWMRPWYPVAFLAGALLELVGAALFVSGRWQGARLLLLLLGVVTLVMHPMWDETARFDAFRNMSLASGLLLSEAVMRGSSWSSKGP